MALAGVRPEYLRAAYAAIEEEFDSVEYDLQPEEGLDTAARSVLRESFVE